MYAIHIGTYICTYKYMNIYVYTRIKYIYMYIHRFKHTYVYIYISRIHMYLCPLCAGLESVAGRRWCVRNVVLTPNADDTVVTMKYIRSLLNVHNILTLKTSLYNICMYIRTRVCVYVDVGARSVVGSCWCV